MFSFFKKLIFKDRLRKEIKEEDIMKKYLIVGLGNIGAEYTETRHNIGFKVMDTLAKKNTVTFTTQKLGDLTSFNLKGRKVILLKPNTYMNLSGKAVLYWMQKEKINPENLLIVTDDIHIDFGAFRIKPKGSAGGHNGLKDIQEKLNSSTYPRFRFGVGNTFGKGRQVDYVLGKWSDKEQNDLSIRNQEAADAIENFVLAGLAKTMNTFNGKMPKSE